MASYYLSVQPHLFQEAVDRQFTVLRETRDEEEARHGAAPAPLSTSTDLVLSWWAAGIGMDGWVGGCGGSDQRGRSTA